MFFLLGSYVLSYVAEVAGVYRVRVTYLGLDIAYPSYTEGRLDVKEDLAVVYGTFAIVLLHLLL